MAAGIKLKCLVNFIPWYAYIIRTVLITIVDVTLENIPVNIAKLMYLDKTNVITLSSLVQCCAHPRNNFW
jgi:hypothetical protein